MHFLISPRGNMLIENKISPLFILPPSHPMTPECSRKMLEICKWRMTVDMQMQRQVGKKKRRKKRGEGKAEKMKWSMACWGEWKVICGILGWVRDTKRTLKIHLKQSRCIIHTIMTQLHTHTHKMTLSTVRTCTHYAYAVSAKKRTWRQGQRVRRRSATQAE